MEKNRMQLFQAVRQFLDGLKPADKASEHPAKLRIAGATTR
jgi:hypothetical protein